MEQTAWHSELLAALSRVVQVTSSTNSSGMFRQNKGTKLAGEAVEDFAGAVELVELFFFGAEFGGVRD